LQVLDRGWITNRQIEAARIAITRHMQRRGQVWIRMFPDKPISKKPLEVRMGKGKGNPDQWVACVKPGRVIFEVTGCSYIIAQEAFSRAANKLPLKCRMLSR
jgi:large subunit ribosomal protein L16